MRLRLRNKSKISESNQSFFNKLKNYQLSIVHYQLLAFALLLCSTTLLSAQTPELVLQNGLNIATSCRIKPQTYRLSASPQAASVLAITGDSITVDFQQAILDGAAPGQLPNAFQGIGIRITGRAVTLKNAVVKGYKIALYAENAADLRLENCDVSYNYRPKLYSRREHEDFSDWLSYHQNERDEWLRYGAGIYLKNCDRPIIRGCRATGNQNALLMTGCQDGLVYNNAFNFNSGLGIGLYRSSRNRLMHNRLDWNVRGYSHGFYQRGQDSAGILLYEQSSDNLIAFNSATHSGDGFFLWAGQSTMDNGQGGCNDNWLFGNDFSHAPTNGIEVTFSRNRIQGNLIRECTYGIWGGYSYETMIHGNLIENCRTAIAIEHGQRDTIRQNLFEGDSVGIQLWARPNQPTDWGYARARDVRSQGHSIDRNVFRDVRKPLKITASDVSVNGENLFMGFEKLLDATKPNERLAFLRNYLYAPAERLEAVWQHPELTSQKGLNLLYPGKQPENPYQPLLTPVVDLREPDSLPDGMNAGLPSNFPRGRRFILMDTWGPYDFRRPFVALDTTDGTRYSLALIGPSGNWRLTTMRGVKTISARSGKLPATLTAERLSNSAEIFLEFEYTGKAVVDAFGNTTPAGKPYPFAFQRLELPLDWSVRFFNAAPSDSILLDTTFQRLIQGKPAAEQRTKDLWFAWWGQPAEGVAADRFITVSTCSFDIAPGNYTLSLSSDDAARLYLDGKRLIDHWTPHESATIEVSVKLGGRHTLRVEHVELGGFGALDCRIEAAK